MANDALDPGPDGNYPHWPRHPDGRPEVGTERMPTGEHRQKVWDGERWSSERVVVDLTLRHPDGTPIVPPTIPPGGEE